MQQYAGIYLLQNFSTSGVHKTVTAASGTGHTTYLSNILPPTWPLATSEEHRGGGITPQAVTHSLVLLKMGKIISRNMLS